MDLPTAVFWHNNCLSQQHKARQNREALCGEFQKHGLSQNEVLAMTAVNAATNKKASELKLSRHEFKGEPMKFNAQAIKRSVLTFAGLMLALSMVAVAQEQRSEVSIEGTGFFTKDTTGNGTLDRATNTGGFLVGYRYNINRWLAAEANYGYDRNTQTYFGSTPARVESNIHQFTGSALVKLPGLGRIQPYALAGGGALVFDPTGNSGGTFSGATLEARGAFLYGAGADYVFTRHISFRGEYRGLVYKAPSFNLASLNTDSWTHIAQPSAGIVFRF